MPQLPLFARVPGHGGRIAVIDGSGEHSYSSLERAASRGAGALCGSTGDLAEARVAFLVAPGFDYVATLWSIWRAGGVAVPLSVHHPLPELEYVLDDTGAAIVIVDDIHGKKLGATAAARGLRLLSTRDLKQGVEGPLPDVSLDRRGMMLYTSGTTSKPKGVVTTHAQLTSQITCLVEAWGWREDDEILHVLPLHHTHGIVNVLLCALWAGAACRMMQGFDAERVWHDFETKPLTVFMAVPTIYSRLIRYWDASPPSRRHALSAACRKFRLMVSGSAALPVSVLETWRQISGHTLLERYGMTEIGMALSNPLHGERRPGTVGRPLPGVIVRLVDDAGREIEREGEAGEIQVKGPNVFLEYWNRPDATADAFVNGWFRTGDTAVIDEGYFRILGRNSVDIIKTGGYKVSALEIEEVLLTHPAVRECAVVGIEDREWGERVCAGIVYESEIAPSTEALRAWAKERLAAYKIPSRVVVLDQLPRNAMGKVTKPEVKALMSPERRD